MSEHSVVIAGLPGSGKTTFLAALWHLVYVGEIDTCLHFDCLGRGDKAHLNAIAQRWRDAVVQDRTAAGSDHTLVSMNLRGTSGSFQVTFPDTAGEAYSRMWESRVCDSEIAEMLAEGGVMMFINADTIRSPRWVVNDVAVANTMGLAGPDDTAVNWHPRLAPTQVQIVDLLQLLAGPPIGAGPRRLAIMLSAWDKAEAEGLAPGIFLKTNLPLLAQYLHRNAETWICRAYGLSAQGGDYDNSDAADKRSADADKLRTLNLPSERIRLVHNNSETHDLTEPLAWLMEL